MISFFEASLRSLSVHRVGNKLQDEFYVLSEEQIPIREEQSSLLMHYFLSPFEKVNESYNLYHPSDIHLNEVYEIITNNRGEEAFHGASQDLAKRLYEVSNHPKIKAGEFYVAYFENIQFEGELFNAVGIFKSENKDVYLKVNSNKEGFDIEFEQDAINISKLDKGCLILNKDIPKGCTVLCIDSSSKDAGYWKDEFLGLQVINNSFNQTSNVLQVAKQFIMEKLDEEYDLSKADKVDLLNKSVKYFKEKESFEIDEFVSEVLNNDRAQTSFKAFKSSYNEEYDLQTPDSFDISNAAVKKQSSSFKPVIKLDKNFQIHINGTKELIERGFDTDKGLNFYKVYFKEEA